MIDLCKIICILELCIIFQIICLLNNKLIYNCIKEQFVIKPECSFEPKLFEIREKIRPLFDDKVVYTGNLANMNKKKILNDTTLCNGDKSFTINKEDVYLCLKDENDKYYHDNMLIYVYIHEVSHLVSKSIGHTSEFHENFKQLLNKAVELKIYDPNIPIIKDYCLYK